MIKAIAIDLDGTLLNQNHTIEPNTLQIIQVLRKKGILVGIATGRPYFNIDFDSIVLEDTFDFCICNNGAECYDFKNNTTHYQHQLSSKTVNHIYQKYKHFGGVPIITDDNVMYPEQKNEFIQMLPDSVDINYDFFHEVLKKDQFKMIYNVTPTQQDQMIEYYSSNPHLEYRAIISQHNLVEFVHPNLSKVSGLEWIAKNHHLTLADFLAMGDSGNDIEMIRECGIGVAMGNALDFVKDAADHITNSNIDNGVYTYLSSLPILG